MQYMPPWYNQKCLRQRDTLVKIHGNWCGPNWTGGKKVAAKDYKGPWNGPIQTPLDACCRSHDFSCSSGKCSKAADTKLIKCAEKRILPEGKAMKMQLQLTNPFLSRSRRKEIEKRLSESQDAVIVATGIEIARIFRRS